MAGDVKVQALATGPPDQRGQRLESCASKPFPTSVNTALEALQSGLRFREAISGEAVSRVSHKILVAARLSASVHGIRLSACRGTAWQMGVTAVSPAGSCLRRPQAQSKTAMRKRALLAIAYMLSMLLLDETRRQRRRCYYCEVASQLSRMSSQKRMRGWSRRVICNVSVRKSSCATPTERRCAQALVKSTGQACSTLHIAYPSAGTHSGTTLQHPRPHKSSY